MKYTPEGAVIPLNEIYVAARARTEMGDLTELRDTFNQVGQIQSITVCRRWEDAPLPGALFVEKPYELLAGGRRYAALLEMGETQVFARIYPVLEEDEKKLVELLENLARVDFSWQDRVALIAKITELQQSRLGKAVTGVKAGWSAGDTANLLKVSTPTVTSALQLKAAAEKNPEILLAKTQKDAMRIMTNSQVNAAQQELARRIAKQMHASSDEKLNPADSI